MELKIDRHETVKYVISSHPEDYNVSIDVSEYGFEIKHNEKSIEFSCSPDSRHDWIDFLINLLSSIKNIDFKKD